VDDVVIAGVGIHPFGRFDSTYREIGAVAVRAALVESGVAPADLDVALVANVGAEMAKGQNVLELVGRPGIPVINVEAACASSAGGLWLGPG
jgi:acetyl-CoA acetyltransferase